ncbi:MAG: BrnT family toxin [Planctomycetes bacterium]|nr:BrnT family toxin [Planctomycetota bacterium]
MDGLRFEWDPGKDRANQRRHGVAFDEAMTVFFDEHALLIEDPEHSEAEDRFIMLGLSSKLRILVVCHCYRSGDDVIRLISARRANKQEREGYNGRLGQ